MKTKAKALKILLIVILGLILGGGAIAAVIFLYPYHPKNPPKADDTGSSKEGMTKVAEANNRFSFEMYLELAKTKNENIFFSPYSISSALAIAYEGAEEKTSEEIAAVFHFPQKDQLRSNFAAIYNKINEGSKEFETRTGNALWVQKDYPLLPEYMTTIEKYHGGKASNVDFIGETEKTRKIINTFIEEQTNNKIKDLLPAGSINPLTRVVITNAIYFKGEWVWQFKPEDTRKMDFKVTPTETVQADMMYMKPEEPEFVYMNSEKLELLELPYKGERFSMVILLPKKSLEELENELTLENFNYWYSNAKKTKLDGIYIPKFKLETKYFMKDTLKNMGMPTPFSQEADFSGMTGKRDLVIDEVIHQAFVEVDEKGTEAAAATGVVMKITGIMEEKIFKADHPFIFLIWDKETGTILFQGRINNPTSGK